jgi:carboxyl-terminal processing protease
MQRSVLAAIGRANQEKVEGFILDLRDGWGGADPAYLTMFSRNVPVLEAVLPDGGVESFDHQIRVPAVLLVNGGTRSGKEGFARGAKKYSLARLVGERTPGSGTFGRPFCLRSGPLIYVGTSEGLFDGENFEGRGTEPDVTVPFDIRYAAGDDKQLTAALNALASPS